MNSKSGLLLVALLFMCFIGHQQANALNIHTFSEAKAPGESAVEGFRKLRTSLSQTMYMPESKGSMTFSERF